MALPQVLRYGFDGVTSISLGIRFNHIVQQQVCIIRAVFGGCLLFGIGVIDRNGNLGLLWKESSHVRAGGYCILEIIIGLSVFYTLLQTSVTGSAHLSGQVYGSYVREPDSKRAVSSHTTFALITYQTQFVYPNLCVLGAHGIVSDTYHYGTHVTY